MRDFKFYLLGLISFVLGGWELYFSILNAKSGEPINILHVVFLALGMLGAVFCYMVRFRKAAKWLLGIFYLLQTVFIYSKTFVFKFVASFAFPFHYFIKNENGIEQTFNNPVGLGVNLFALLMLFFVYKVFNEKSST
ncbi:hypothetical protein [Aliiglaciecola litoralis]|uniref:hypothetical protein n=1 Tax=Aliiglaciecola litoralis TaxID=582857 RepID=UPI0031D89E5D